MNRKQLVAVLAVLAAVAGGVYLARDRAPAPAPIPAEGAAGQPAGMSGVGGTAPAPEAAPEAAVETAPAEEAPACTRYDWDGTAWVCSAHASGG